MSCWITSHMLGVRSALKSTEELNSYKDGADSKWGIVRKPQQLPKYRCTQKGKFFTFTAQLTLHKFANTKNTVKHCYFSQLS